MSRKKIHTGDTLFPIDETTAIIFPTDYNSILKRINDIDASKYARTRNFINGAVTYLSPYIARGVIGLPQVLQAVMHNKKLYEVEKLVQELAWREYFQRIWQFYEPQIFTDLKREQPNVSNHSIAKSIVNACTQIDGIDKGISNLYATGYMHNHVRMYTAMLACNIGKSQWQQPSQWMYYHLLDGDLASNTLSWQWVAGSFSSKKYYANQENISKYTGSNQQRSYLANDYEALANMDIPEQLQEITDLHLTTALPARTAITINTNLPTLVYNSYNLDPLWHNNETMNRVLLLEPSHFTKYPVSEKVLTFIIALAKNNISGIQIFVGEFNELLDLLPHTLENEPALIYKEHPTNQHYKGFEENRHWMFPEVTGNFNSFFAYWKKCEKYLK